MTAGKGFSAACQECLLGSANLGAWIPPGHGGTGMTALQLTPLPHCSTY